MQAPTVSREADQFFTALPPLVGKVAKIAATATASSTDLSAAGALGPKCEGFRYEIRSDADVVWAVGVSGATLAVAGTVADGQSGGTLKANERVQFLLPLGMHYLYAVTSTGTANIEIRAVGDIGLDGAKQRLG